MIRRLLEAHYFQNQEKPSQTQIRFWLLELRTPQLLIETARSNPRLCLRLASRRPLLAHALHANPEELERSLMLEESAERERDRQYWAPLPAELQKMRHGQIPTSPPQSRHDTE